MPDFESREFVDVAEDIMTSKSGENQAYLRTVVGRSYYGAYGKLRRALILTGPNRFGDGGLHRPLINVCNEPGNPQLHDLGDRLKTLHALRSRADYQFNPALNITLVEAQDSIELAKEALEMIDKLFPGDLACINRCLGKKKK